MDTFKRIWPALVVGALWLVFMALRLVMPDGTVKAVSATPEFYEYRRPVVEEKMPVKEPHPTMKEPRKVQPLSAPPSPRAIPQDKPAEHKAEAVYVVQPAAQPSVEEKAPVIDPKTVVQSAPAPVVSAPVLPAPVVVTPHPPLAGEGDPELAEGSGEGGRNAVLISPAAATVSGSDTPAPPPIPLNELPQAVNRTIKGAMLTIELEPPAGTGSDDFLQTLGARRVNERQLWDSDVIRKYELSGQVYVFKLSGGGRVLLPPTLLARIISAVEAETNGELLYRGRILLGPNGRIVVKEAVKL